MPQDPKRKLAKKMSRKLGGGITAQQIEEFMVDNPPGLLLRQPMHTWPVREALVSTSWRDPHDLTQVIVVREVGIGPIGVGSFLVDLGCLGVKDAFARRFESYEEFVDELLEPMRMHMEFEPVSFDLAAKIVLEGVRYAQSLGFRPHEDYGPAARFLHDAQPERAEEEVPLGKDGMPLYVNGPYDNVQKIMTQLNRSVGEGNYEVVLFSPGSALPPLE